MANYSRESFQTIYEDLVKFVESGTTKWKPSNSTEADAGVVILKLIAMLEDKHGYKFDMAMNQNYLDGVSDRESAYELLKELGYLMKQARSATGYVELLPESSWVDLMEGKTNIAERIFILPRFSVITDATKTVKFFTTEEVVQVADALTTKVTENSYRLNNTRIRVPVQAGEIFKITKEGFEYFTLKDIDEQGRLYLGKSGLAQNGIYVMTLDDEGEAHQDWTYLDFAILKPSGKWYEVHTAETGEMYVQFPANFEELVSTTKLEIMATYTTGAASNVSKGLLSTWEDTAYKKYYAIQQTDNIYTGQDEESIQLAIDNYYATKDICNSLVTAQDFESAIKYLLISIESNIGNIGERYFSNVVVSTAADRKSSVRTICEDVEYNLFTPDVSKPSNQIDVIALRASEDYSKSFQQIADKTEIEIIEADLAQQLHNNAAVDADVKIDAETKRLLAVTAPRIRIRVSNYTEQLDTQIRQKIKSYLYSLYKAENLVPGRALDYQTIVDGIQALSPNIVSVAMSDLTYDIFEEYKGVDDDNIRVGTDRNIKITGEEEQSSLSDLQKEAVARAVIRGDVPLFRFRNRQNTRTKMSNAYALLANSDKNASFESVLAIPPGYSAANSPFSEKAVSPVVYDFETVQSSALDDLVYLQSELKNNEYLDDEDIRLTGGFDFIAKAPSANQVLQFRKPVYVEADTYSYGMKYKFWKKIDIVSNTAIQAGTKLSAGTVIAVGSQITPEDANDTFDASVATKVGDSYQFIKKVALKSAVDVSSGTLAAGSVVMFGSIWGGMSVDSEHVLEDEKNNDIREGEELIITNNAGEVQRVFRKGDHVVLSGFQSDIAMSTTPQQITSSTMAITSQVRDVAHVSTNFVYFLSLRSEEEHITIPAKGRMLEEGEVFVYADRGVTEYVTLGPGTLLKPESTDESAFIELINTPFTALEEISQSMFKTLDSPLLGEAFEYTTYSGPFWIAYAIDKEDETSKKFFSNEWELLTGDVKIAGEKVQGTNTKKVYVFADKSPISVDELFNMTEEGEGAKLVTEDDAIYKTTGNDEEVRCVFKLVTSDAGVATVEYPCSITISELGNTVLTTEQKAERTIVGGSEGDNNTKGVLISTVPFTGVYSEKNASQSLLGSGVSAKFAFGTITEANYTGIDGRDSIVGVDSVSVIVPKEDPFTASTAETLVKLPLYFPDGENTLALFNIDISSFKEIRYNNQPIEFTVSCWVTEGTEKKVSKVFRLSDIAQTGEVPTGDVVVLSNATQDVFGVTLGILAKNLPKNNEMNLFVEISKPVKADIKNLAEIFYGTLKILKISYVQDYATELGIDESLYTGEGETKQVNWKILQEVAKLDTQRRFNWLALPTEKYSKPLSSEAILTEGHPLNKRVFPYIDLSAAEIIITKER